MLQKNIRTTPVNVTGKSDRSADPALPARLRLNLRLREVFVATARAGSTRSAAERVARSRSAASAALDASPQHALAGARRVSAAQLRALEWAVREPGSGTREASDRWLLEQLGLITIAFELGSTEALKRLVATGVAVGCLSRHAVRSSLAARELVELRTGLPLMRRRLALVVHRDKHLGRGAEVFLRDCRAVERAGTTPRAGGAVESGLST